MCVAIAKKVGAEITDQTLDNCYRFNKDGCGFAYLEPKGKGFQIKVYKTLSFPQFKIKLRELEAKYPSSPMLIHFRAMSKGAISLDNCHPFIIDSHHVFIHNGTIGKAPDDTLGKKSDTVMFNETTLQMLPKGWYGNPAVRTLIEDYIGMSKLAVMNNQGEFQLFNESKGEWAGDIWYSNTQFKTPPPQKKAKKQKGSSKNYQSHTHHNNSVNYCDDEEYCNVDWDLYSNEFEAFHGQNRLRANNKGYEKFDYHKKRWIDITIWDAKYLHSVNHSDDYTKEEKIYGYALTQPEIVKAANEAGVTKKVKDFTLKCTDMRGKVHNMSFTRCEFCNLPDYTDSMFISTLAESDDSYLLCDECNHNLKIHGALKEDS